MERLRSFLRRRRQHLLTEDCTRIYHLSGVNQVHRDAEISQVALHLGPISAMDAAVFGRYARKDGACRAVGATANLDSSCARRPEQTAGPDGETGFQVEQRNWGRKDVSLWKLFDKRSPIQGFLSASSRSTAAMPSANSGESLFGLV